MSSTLINISNNINMLNVLLSFPIKIERILIMNCFKENINVLYTPELIEMFRFFNNCAESLVRFFLIKRCLFITKIKGIIKQLRNFFNRR